MEKIPKSVLLNDDGYRALQEGKAAAALELFRLSVLECRRTGDVEGEVVALENTYLALRALRRYPEALETIIALLDPMFRSGLYPKVLQYFIEISQATVTLAQMGDPYVVREASRDADVRRGIAELGSAEALRARGLLMVSADQDMLEVLGQTPGAERVRFVDRFTAEVVSRTDALGRSLRELVEGQGPER